MCIYLPIHNTKYKIKIDLCVNVMSSTTENDAASSSMKKDQSDTVLEDKNLSKYNRYKMKRVLLITAYVVGSLFLIFGFLVTGFWRKIYNSSIASRLVLNNSNDSETYTTWSQNIVPIFINIYLFNWTNPVASLAKLEKPSFVETGPYVFSFRQIKENITWNNNDTVSYRLKRRFDFIPELSNGSLSDTITSVNVVAVALGSKAKYLSKWQKIFLSPVISYNEKTLYITKTVKEFLFDGYEDKLLSMAKVLKKYFKDLNYLTDRFGWWYGKNMSAVDEFNINTGKKDINKLGLVHNWNYRTHCKAFTGNCDLVQGSTGDLWPMNMAEKSNASIFVSDLCSAFTLKNMGTKYVNDVEGIQFAGNDELFDNGTKYTTSTCFCPNNKCEIPSGVRNATPCFQAPAFISFPHFYLADKSYRENISGMNPEPDKHKFHLILQKESSITIDVSARLQINILLEPVVDFAFMENVPRIFIPAMWFEEYVKMPDSLVDRLKFTFNTLPRMIDAGCLIFVILGAIILVSGIIVSRLHYFSIPYSEERLEG